MSFIGMCVTCLAAFGLLMAVLKGLSFFLTQRIDKGYELSVSTFLFGSGSLFGLVFFLIMGIILYPFSAPGAIQIMGVSGLALGTIFLDKDILVKKSYRLTWLFLLCLCGSLLAPQTAAFWGLPFSWVLYVPLAAVWMGFILLMTLFDRIVLAGFLSLSALIGGIVLASSDAFSMLPNAFNMAFIILLFLLLGLVYYLKNNQCYLLGKPAVYFTSYLIGYVGIVFTAAGKGAFVPVFVSYELFELVIALGANFWVYKRFFPLETPFMLETALMKNIAPDKLLRSVFWWCLMFALLGVVSVNSLSAYRVAPFVLAAMFLSLVYIRLKDWGKPKVRYRDLFSDLKKGYRALKEEALNPKVPLKKKTETPKNTKKKK